MKTLNSPPNSLLEKLPPVRGRYSRDSALSRVTWLRVGGPAEILFKPADLEDLQTFLKNRPADIPLTFLGVGSNMLVRDGGIPGVVIRLGQAFTKIKITGRRIEAGAAVLDLTLAKKAAAAGIAGLEFYAGIPGTVGGALRMNAGAYNAETKDILKSARAITPEGILHEIDHTEMGFSYRHCAIPEDWIFVGATFEGQAGQSEEIKKHIKEIQTARAETQPVKSRTGGSTFKNPKGQKAWRLIDEAGCRGLMIGQAQISNQHCNFLINTGEASADDLEKLGETVRRKVLCNSGVNLQWEIKRLGKPHKKSHKEKNNGS